MGAEITSSSNSPRDGDMSPERDANSLTNHGSGSEARTPPTESQGVKIEADPSVPNGQHSESKTPSSSKLATPDVDLRRSIWTPIIQDLATQLGHEAWEIRHGSSLALKDLIRLHGESYGMEDNMTEPENSQSRERCLGAIAAALLEMLALDRFGDFIGDQVIAPVREAGSQALASLMRHLEIGTIGTIHSTLLKMILQDWSDARAKGSKNMKSAYVWELRHAGLLGLKYELAVRPDLITGESPKAEDAGSKAYIEGVLQGSLLGYVFMAGLSPSVRLILPRFC